MSRALLPRQFIIFITIIKSIKEKLLKSAIANYEAKTETKVEENTLVVKSVMVDSGLMVKRLRTAPQGRGYRIRKRTNHVTLEIGTKTLDKK